MNVPQDQNQQRLLQPIWRLLKKLFTVYILVVILLALLQRKLMYHPQTADQLAVRDFPAVTELFPHARDAQMTCADGVQIRGWLLQKEDRTTENRATETRPLVIYFHGNAGDRSSRVGWYKLFEQLDVDVLAIDYHGYGDSGGNISEMALELDCDAAWAFAVGELGVIPQEIYLIGTSLGGAAAVYLAAKQSQAGTAPAALVTVSTFSSMVDAASNHYPWLPVRLVLLDRYPSDKRVGNITCPVLMFHGDRDRVVQQRFGKKLFDAAPATSTGDVAKKWVNLPDVGHNDILYNAASVIFEELSDLLAARQDVRK